MSTHAATASETALETASQAAFDPASFAQALAHWFHGAQRDLPWRDAQNARDPYRVLVSELMLQQTTVAAVVPFYNRFLIRFPTVAALAESSIEDVLPLWAGLGYYQRARLLHAAARAVMERHDGVFPRALEDVLALPGVGRYTAGAVTSIAFDDPSPIVDANVARVFSRLFLLEGDLKNAANQTQLWHHAQDVVDICPVSPGDAFGSDAFGSELCRPSIVNPALMELGALICVPRVPRCALCPVADWCAARKQGRQNELPHIAAKRATVELRDFCAFITSDAATSDTVISDAISANSHRNGEFFPPMSTHAGAQRVLLRQRPDRARVWWRGMWELPRVSARDDESAEDALSRLLREELGCDARDFQIGPRLKSLRHGVTHHQITLECRGVSLAQALNNEHLLDATPLDATPLDDESSALAASSSGATWRWFSWEATRDLAMPSSMRRLLAWLETHLTPEQASLFPDNT